MPFFQLDPLELATPSALAPGAQIQMSALSNPGVVPNIMQTWDLLTFLSSVAMLGFFPYSELKFESLTATKTEQSLWPFPVNVQVVPVNATLTVTYVPLDPTISPYQIATVPGPSAVWVTVQPGDSLTFTMNTGTSYELVWFPQSVAPVPISLALMLEPGDQIVWLWQGEFDIPDTPGTGLTVPLESYAVPQIIAQDFFNPIAVSPSAVIGWQIGVANRDPTLTIPQGLTFVIGGTYKTTFNYAVQYAAGLGRSNQ